MNEKGASRIDKAAHIVAEFVRQSGAYGVTQIGTYTAFYHESRLYTVRNEKTGITALVYANNPYAAIRKATSNTNTETAIAEHRLTVEETIDQLQDLIKDRESFMVGDYDKDIYDMDKEALQIAIEALEKLIPQEPLGGSDYSGNDYMICRNCSAIVEDDDWRATYCPDCGQAIKWEEQT